MGGYRPFFASFRELKENNIYPQIYTDGHRCPQADEVGEQQLFASSSSKSKFFTHCQTKEEFIKLRKFSRIYSHIANIKKSSSSSASFRELKEIGPQADEDGEQQLPAIIRKFSINRGTHQAKASGQQLSKKYYAPWMICEPNVKEGRKLLAEIMQGGNFGQYDTRDAALKKGGMMKHGLWKLKRVMRLVSSYPEEALWEPVFRV